jgi:hypothetical protein
LTIHPILNVDVTSQEFLQKPGKWNVFWSGMTLETIDETRERV